MDKLLLTGATGFVGRALLSRLIIDRKYSVKAVSRNVDINFTDDIEPVFVKDLGPYTDCKNILSGVSIVIHAAGRAHILNKQVANSIIEYRRVNVEGTLNLARQAADLGIKRFIFISTIGVNGAESHGGRFTESSNVSPHSPYAVSKYEAELGLRAIEHDTGMEVVIIRPPLIYGPDPPGNLATLLKIISLGCPLPFGLANNKKTLISLDNLVDFVIRCACHAKAAGETFLAGDAQDVSTKEIIRCLAKGMERQIIQVSVPMALMKMGAYILGRQAMYQQLFGSLRIDITKARTLLDWTPPVNVTDGLVEVGQYYASMHG